MFINRQLLFTTRQEHNMGKRKAQYRKNKIPLIQKHGQILAALANSSPKWRKKMIADAPSSIINAVSECCKNVLKGNVNLTSSQKQKLAPRCQHLRLLASKSFPIKKKKRILNQKGGALLGLLLKPLLGAALGSVLR